MFSRGLVVEDLPDSAAWLAEVLGEAFPGIAVRTAGALEDASTLLKDWRPDVALIDLGLPDGSGIDLIRVLSGREPPCLCVVASIFDDDQHLFPALRAGARGYLLKDQARNELAQRLHGIGRGEPPLSPSIARRLLGHFQPPPQGAEQPLTPRETEVLTLIAKGYTVPHVAAQLGLSANTVAGYVKEIYRKLDVSNRAEATLAAARRGIVQNV
ncbi:MAG: response regulator transcription factor [Chromatiales bacterium]|jgi:DNA-binding NarL/FixJ family response regulator|nr:response regulator transcription factor [Chromatiales bacterium]MDX9766290.1 response regulator transcription factor [Ectothiorhodospiraceae bacterium]